MALAKYTVQIPTHDNEGNRLKDLATAAHESLYRHAPYRNRIMGSRIIRGVIGNWANDPQEPFDDLVVFVEDTPEMDSVMKQLGVHVAEVANQWGVMVFKEGEGAPQAWMMTHEGTTGAGAADPVAIESPSNPDGITSAVYPKRKARHMAGLLP